MRKIVASEVRKKTLYWSQSCKIVTTVLCIEPIPEERWLAFVWHQGTNSSSLSMCIARITVTVAKYISAKPQISRGLAELMHKHENSL